VIGVRLRARLKDGLTIIGTAATLAVLLRAALRHRDNEAPSTEPGAHDDDPTQVLGFAVERTPGFEWTPEEEAKAVPMPLLPPPWEKADEG
jgi:hypothetical protein